MKSNRWIIGAVALLVLISMKTIAYAVKPGAVVPSTPEMDYAKRIVATVWGNHDRTATITSGIDGEHREDSLHYSGLALDFRTKDLPANLKLIMVSEVSDMLGSQYDVMLEYVGSPNEHLHIEFDPE